MPRRRQRSTLVVTLGLALFGLAAACLAGAAALERPALGLTQLVTHDDVVLMSCDPSVLATSAASHNTQSPEPLWCANPDSPHCQPGQQTPTHHETFLGPVTALATAPSVAASTFLWSEAARWPAARDVPQYAYADCHRLERPPRHS